MNKKKQKTLKDILQNQPENSKVSVVIAGDNGIGTYSHFHDAIVYATIKGEINPPDIETAMHMGLHIPPKSIYNKIKKQAIKNSLKQMEEDRIRIFGDEIPVFHVTTDIAPPPRERQFLHCGFDEVYKMLVEESERRVPDTEETDKEIIMKFLSKLPLWKLKQITNFEKTSRHTKPLSQRHRERIARLASELKREYRMSIVLEANGELNDR